MAESTISDTDLDLLLSKSTPSSPSEGISDEALTGMLSSYKPQMPVENVIGGLQGKLRPSADASMTFGIQAPAPASEQERDIIRKGLDRDKMRSARDNILNSSDTFAKKLGLPSRQLEEYVSRPSIGQAKEFFTENPIASGIGGLVSGVGEAVSNIPQSVGKLATDLGGLAIEGAKYISPFMEEPDVKGDLEAVSKIPGAVAHEVGQAFTPSEERTRKAIEDPVGTALGVAMVSPAIKGLAGLGKTLSQGALRGTSKQSTNLLKPFYKKPTEVKRHVDYMSDLETISELKTPTPERLSRDITSFDQRLAENIVPKKDVPVDKYDLFKDLTSEKNKKEIGKSEYNSDWDDAAREFISEQLFDKETSAHLLADKGKALKDIPLEDLIRVTNKDITLDEARSLQKVIYDHISTSYKQGRKSNGYEDAYQHIARKLRDEIVKNVPGSERDLYEMSKRLKVQGMIESHANASDVGTSHAVSTPLIKSALPKAVSAIKRVSDAFMSEHGVTAREFGKATTEYDQAFKKYKVAFSNEKDKELFGIFRALKDEPSKKTKALHDYAEANNERMKDVVARAKRIENNIQSGVTQKPAGYEHKVPDIFSKVKLEKEAYLTEKSRVLAEERAVLAEREKSAIDRIEAEKELKAEKDLVAQLEAAKKRQDDYKAQRAEVKTEHENTLTKEKEKADALKAEAKIAKDKAEAEKEAGLEREIDEKNTAAGVERDRLEKRNKEIADADIESQNLEPIPQSRAVAKLQGGVTTNLETLSKKEILASKKKLADAEANLEVVNEAKASAIQESLQNRNKEVRKAKEEFRDANNILVRMDREIKAKTREADSPEYKAAEASYKEAYKKQEAAIAYKKEVDRLQKNSHIIQKMYIGKPGEVPIAGEANNLREWYKGPKEVPDEYLERIMNHLHQKGKDFGSIGEEERSFFETFRKTVEDTDVTGNLKKKIIRDQLKETMDFFLKEDHVPPPEGTTTKPAPTRREGDRALGAKKDIKPPEEPSEPAKATELPKPPKPSPSGYTPESNPGARASDRTAGTQPEPPPVKPETGRSSSGREVGKKTKIRVDKNTGYEAEYQVVEGDTIHPSHDPLSFEENTNYPKNIQERDYTDKNKRLDVTTQSQNIDPEQMINNAPGPETGPPMVSQDDLVLGGNGRTMTLQRASKIGDTSAYINYLIENASTYGIDAEKIKGMKNPILIRRMTLKEGASLRDVVSDLNKTATSGMKTSERSVSSGARISQDTMDWVGERLSEFGEEASVKKVLASNPKEMINRLVRDGVIEGNKKANYYNDKDNLFTSTGKTFVEEAMFGRIIDDINLMEILPDAIKAKIESVIAPLAKVKDLEGWSLGDGLKDAARMAIDAKKMNFNSYEYLRQSKIGGTGYTSPQANSLFEMLMDDSTATVKEKVRAYADRADATIRNKIKSEENKSSMFPEEESAFKTESPSDVFNEIFGKREAFREERKAKKKVAPPKGETP